MTPPAKDSHALAKAARDVVARLQTQGHVTYWAGGCVRDRLLNLEPADYDIATAATPEEVISLFPGALEVGRAFGVLIVQQGGFDIEVATFREEGGYEDGRHPDFVSFSTDARDDALRRDFTINAMFYDPIADTLHDFVEGQQDVTRRLIRCVGRAADRFRDDHLRMMRAVRFATRFGFQLTAETRAAIQQHATHITRISPERIREELTRTMMEAQRAGDALALLDDLGLLGQILPEVSALKEQEQPPQFHPEGDVLTHVIMMLNTMEVRSPTVIYAVLFHDIAKPATAEFSKGRIRFNGHAELGADMAADIMKRLRFSRQMIEDVGNCVRRHMRFIDVPNMRRSTLRRMVGADIIDAELELHRLDCLSSHGMLDNYEFLQKYRADMAAEPVLPAPWVTGRDIMALGIPEGRAIGEWHRRAYDQQLEGNVDSREALLAWLKEALTNEDSH